MIEILECCVYKPVMFLKLYGYHNVSENEQIYIYRKEVRLGEAIKGIWTVEKGREEKEESKENWVFTKVLSDFEEGETLFVQVVKEVGRRVYAIEVKVDMKEQMPSYLLSQIGTKNNLTVNSRKEEEEFVKQQESYNYIPPLRHLTIESSSLCNLRCKYCIVSNNYYSIERCIISEQVLDEAIATVNRFYEQGLRTVQLNALGEPLTNPDFVKIVQRIYRETKIRDIIFFNNGMLFTKEVSEALAEIPMNFNIKFSLDGLSALENNEYRAGSDYQRVKENIYFFLHTIARKENFSVGINNLQVKPLEHCVNVPEFLLEDFGFIPIDSHRAFYFPELSEKKLKKDKINIYSVKEKRVCRRIFSEATIRANGDVIRCHWDSSCEIVMGNILQQPLEKIWSGSKYIAYRKEMLDGADVESLPIVCQHCHAQNNGFIYRKKKTPFADKLNFCKKTNNKL